MSDLELELRIRGKKRLKGRQINFQLDALQPCGPKKACLGVSCGYSDHLHASLQTSFNSVQTILKNYTVRRLASNLISGL